MNGTLRTILVAIGTVILIAGILFAAGALSKDIENNTKLALTNQEAVKSLTQMVHAQENSDVRMDQCLKDIKEKVDMILIQMNSLSAMMQTTAVDLETTKVKIEMIQGDMNALKTQVAEALRTR